MKNFLLGCIVGGFVTSKTYDWFIKHWFDFAEKPSFYYTKIFTNLKWDREEKITKAIEVLKEAASEKGFVTIATMVKIFNLKVTNDGHSLNYAVNHGLSLDDICKITPMKSVTKPGYWQMNYHQGISELFNLFTEVDNTGNEETEEETNER